MSVLPLPEHLHSGEPPSVFPLSASAGRGIFYVFIQIMQNVFGCNVGATVKNCGDFQRFITIFYKTKDPLIFIISRSFVIFFWWA